MFYRKVYPWAWQLVKNNPFLLLLGLFASLLGFHEVKLIFAWSEASPDFLSSTFNFWFKLFSTFAVTEVNISTLPSLLGLVLIFVILAAVLILAISAQAALIKSTAEKSGRLKHRFADYLHQGVSRFWPLFGLHLVNILIGYFFVISVINPLIAYVASSANYLQYLVLSLVIFFVLLPLVIILSFVTRYGMAYIMIKNQKFLEAFISSWELFKINWLITVENAIFITIVTALFLLAMAAGMVFVFVPFFFLSVFVGALNPALYILFVLIGTLAALLILLLASALYGAYYNIVWAKVFIELTTGGRNYSKIYRLGQKHLSGKKTK